MFRNIAIGMLVLGLAAFCAASASASTAVLGEEYGTGVHAYFGGDFIVAHARLTDVIDAGSKDPRAFYFRGLSYLKLGRGQEAEVDFRHGAELESKDLNRFYNVGKALERVQGRDRVRLEKFRLDARMAAMVHAEKIRKARYEAIRREEARVLREQALAAPKKPIEEVPAPSSDPDNPFAVPEQKNPFAAPGEQPESKPDDKENPFAEEPKEKPDVKEDPFAEEPKEKPKVEEDPFGEDEKDAPADPFDEESEEKNPEEKKPEEKKPDEKKADPDDPFN